MTATFTYNLPEEESEMNLALRAGDVHNALYNLDQDFRGQLKHGIDAERFPDVASVMEYVRKHLNEAVEDL